MKTLETPNGSDPRKLRLVQRDNRIALIALPLSAREFFLTPGTKLVPTPDGGMSIPNAYEPIRDKDGALTGAASKCNNVVVYGMGLIWEYLEKEPMWWADRDKASQPAELDKLVMRVSAPLANKHYYIPKEAKCQMTQIGFQFQRAYTEVLDATGKVIATQKHFGVELAGMGIVIEGVSEPSWWPNRDAVLV